MDSSLLSSFSSLAMMAAAIRLPPTVNVVVLTPRIVLPPAPPPVPVVPLPVLLLWLPSVLVFSLLAVSWVSLSDCFRSSWLRSWSWSFSSSRSLLLLSLVEGMPTFCLRGLDVHTCRVPLNVP